MQHIKSAGSPSDTSFRDGKLFCPEIKFLDPPEDLKDFDKVSVYSSDLLHEF